MTDGIVGSYVLTETPTGTGTALTDVPLVNACMYQTSPL